MKYLKQPDFKQNIEANREALDRELRRYIDSRIEDAVSEWRYFRFVHFIKLIKVQAIINKLAPAPPPPRKMSVAHRHKLFEEILREAARTVRGWGGKFYFVLLPVYESIAFPGLQDVAEDNWHERCAANEIPNYLCNQNNKEELISRSDVLKFANLVSDRTIYPLEKMAEDPDPLSFIPLRMPNHFNGKGYRIIADSILPYLAKDLLE